MKKICSIIVPVYGDESFLAACVAAIQANTPKLYELILVDNATGYEMDADCVIRNESNKGFAIASNQGATAATGDILVMLNVDTEVQPGWLENLLTAFDEPDVAMAGPKIIHPDGSLQTSGIRTWHGGGSAGGEEIKQDLPTRDVDGVTGACLAIRRSVFHELGGFDAEFLNGYEDVALCLSLREAGYRVRYVRESLIKHHESATSPERWTHAHENVALMNQRWGAR